MSDHTEHALQAAVKALSEVVAPAVDRTDPLAVDQLRLVVSWLQFHGRRRHQERDFARAGLRLRVAQAVDVMAVVARWAPDVAGRLGTALDEARAALAREGTAADAWDGLAQRLDGLVCEAVLQSAGWPDEPRQTLAACVLAHARDVLLLNRAWFAPLGFEARPEAVPDLETLMSGTGSS